MMLSNQMAMCVCVKSLKLKLAIVGVNYTENNVAQEDPANTLRWVCQNYSMGKITVVPLYAHI